MLIRIQRRFLECRRLAMYNRLLRRLRLRHRIRNFRMMIRAVGRRLMSRRLALHHRVGPSIYPWQRLWARQWCLLRAHKRTCFVSSDFLFHFASNQSLMNVLGRSDLSFLVVLYPHCVEDQWLRRREGRNGGLYCWTVQKRGPRKWVW